MSEKNLHNPETPKSKETAPRKQVDPKTAKAVGHIAVKNAKKG
jgi:hypothetical protein